MSGFIQYYILVAYSPYKEQKVGFKGQPNRSPAMNASGALGIVLFLSGFVLPAFPEDPGNYIEEVYIEKVKAGIDPVPDTKFLISASFGPDHRWLGTDAEDDEDYREYLKKAMGGYNYFIDCFHFFSKRYGIGLMYERYWTSAGLDNVVIVDPESGTFLGTGSIQDNIEISMFGPSFIIKGSLNFGRINPFVKFAFGRIWANNNASSTYKDFKIKAGTMGFNLAAGVDYIFWKHLACGAHLFYTRGNIFENANDYTINGTAMGARRIEDLSRTGVNIGLRYYQFNASSR